MRRTKDIAQHIVEYLLIVVFALAAYGEIAYEDAVTEGVLGFLFSDPLITTIYAVWFALLALGLLFAKIRRKKKLHKHVLAAMYLTTVYTISLSWAAFGFGISDVIDDGVIGFAAAVCWLRWKILTEYIDPKQIYNETVEVRDDLPPVPPPPNND